MNLADVDRTVGYSEGFGPIAQALQWLDTLTRSPAVQWRPGQLEAAKKVLKDARRVLYSDLMTLARDAVNGANTPPAEPFLVPYDLANNFADWDSLVKGNTAPFSLDPGTLWCRVLVYGAPNLQGNVEPERQATDFQAFDGGERVDHSGRHAR